MGLYKIKKGLDLPISGGPEQIVSEGASPKRVAIVAGDYIGLQPSMRARVGDEVKRGQALFEDESTPGVVYTSPGAGIVAAIYPGDGRALQTVAIELNDRERAGSPGDGDCVAFESYSDKALVTRRPEEIRALLLESGLWTALRTRPFGKVADPARPPEAVFVTAMDTNPLAPSADVVYKGNEQAFETGLICITRLTDGKVYLCKAPGAAVKAPAYSGILTEEFAGPHPAGNVGTHIHFLDPVHAAKTVWHLDCQDVIAIGKLFMTGKLDVTRVVSLAGPPVRKPRLLRTRLGVSLDDLTGGEFDSCIDVRVISGSVFNGRAAMGAVFGYLGRYHHQVTVVEEGRKRALLDWLRPGANLFSVTGMFSSRFARGPRKFDFTTALHGARRAAMPIGVYERVMPLDIQPSYLLRAIVAGDIERAIQLGCLELDEEDLALCTFVSPSKIEYGPALRTMLTDIEAKRGCSGGER
ncbi:MAG: Na+-transporting NADH:ubiquinone oxidoreductase subunit [Candidatus Hydrogenedentes bacterium]|nr:Na+-transporting NADH:ubiquinone oxidoreductase subunit [Candidatus Hydrogenedentota bacterium]